MEKDWITWNGGDCPVSPETIVQCRLLGGEGWHEQEMPASDWYWKGPEEGFGPEDWNIIAYRIVREV